MLNEVLEMVENMSAEEREALLNTEFPEDLEKQASAQLAQSDLFEGLYAYGATMATLDLESEEELDKTASEQAQADEVELTQFLEEKINESGILGMEDEVELHKVAQVAAAYLFAGYADTLEKEAAKKDGHLARMGKFLKKHKGKAAAGAAGVAALGIGARMAKRHMDKKASELTVAEVTAEVLYNEQVMDVINDGLEKCAAKGKTVAEAAKKSFGKVYNYAKAKAKAGADIVKKHPGKVAAGVGGAGALGAIMARKKKKED